MKPMILILAVVAALALAPVTADAGRTKVVHRGPHGRTTVVVRTGHPIRRALPRVYVRPPRVVPRVVGALFLPAVVYRTVIVERPAPAVLAWEDSEWLEKDEDWTDFTLNADSHGRALMLEVTDGKAQVEFAEVVFENGDVQVVDFDKSSLKAGTYSLLDFKDGRKVDHVRMVARAKSDEARIVLMMVK